MLHQDRRRVAGDRTVDEGSEAQGPVRPAIDPSHLGGERRSQRDLVIASLLRCPEAHERLDPIAAGR